MGKPYSQLRAMLSITRASLTAILRSPSAVIFSLAFPLIFILVFGFIGNGGGVSLRVGIDPRTDTTLEFYKAVRSVDGLNLVTEDSLSLYQDLSKGRLTAILNIKEAPTTSPAFQIDLVTSEAVNPRNVRVIRSILESLIETKNKKYFTERPTYAVVNSEVRTIPGRVYRTIDFILPGQLGFSLLSAGVFGVAFIFYSLRQTLVLKRFYATPVTRTYIVLGEALSRIIFQMSTAVIILLVGHFAFDFTLYHGWITFVELLLLSFIGLTVFMGYGFIVSGLAKNEGTIPPVANLFTLPQFLLSGTFFPIDNFPNWLQPICKFLPLTYLNDAMRTVAFEGTRLSECGKQLGVLAIWGVVVYTVAIRVFKWE